MSTTKARGAGAEAAGDPIGGGGPLHVLRARAVAGQICRVVFNEAPRAYSAAGVNDALNPANYAFAIVAGIGTAPTPMAVDPNLVVGPVSAVAGPVVITAATNASPIVVTTLTPHGRATGDSVRITGALGNTAANGARTVVVTDAFTFSLVGSTGSGSYTGGGIVTCDERAVDVHVDRELIVGLSYTVTARAIVSATGQGLGYPYSARFVGAVALQERTVQAVRASMIDFDNPPGRGTWQVDDSGDLANAGGRESLRKRNLRRLTTKRDNFKWLRGYGLLPESKEVASIAQVAAIKQDAIQQLMQEPEAAAVEVQAELDGRGIFTLRTATRTKAGAVVEAGLQITPGKGFQVL